MLQGLLCQLEIPPVAAGRWDTGSQGHISVAAETPHVKFHSLYLSPVWMPAHTVQLKTRNLKVT